MVVGGADLEIVDGADLEIVGGADLETVGGVDLETVDGADLVTVDVGEVVVALVDGGEVCMRVNSFQWISDQLCIDFVVGSDWQSKCLKHLLLSACYFTKTISFASVKMYIIYLPFLCTFPLS